MIINTNKYDQSFLPVSGSEEAVTKQISGLHTTLSGLRRYTNYSVTVCAFTAAGDGVRAAPVYCHTEEDGKRILSNHPSNSCNNFSRNYNGLVYSSAFCSGWHQSCGFFSQQDLSLVAASSCSKWSPRWLHFVHERYWGWKRGNTFLQFS